MRYENIIYGRFVKRLNRFTAEILINNTVQLVHVKNTGRCEQLLKEGAKVSLQKSDKPERKTAYDLIAAYGEFGWVNIDSTAPNVVAGEWLSSQGFSLIRPEYRFGDSRIDFYMELGSDRYLMEVKGCTFRDGNIGYFPDAPTERGIKHLRELSVAVAQGYTAIAAYVIPMNGVKEVRPNVQIHPEYAEAFTDAVRAGVKILYLQCISEADSLCVINAEYAE